MFRVLAVLVVLMFTVSVPAEEDVKKDDAPDSDSPAQNEPAPSGSERGEPGKASPGQGKERGYIDLDRDGANDRFQDANGDGVNDVTKTSYPHRFLFVDEDEDGKNDRFTDQDGDGVNDLSARYVDMDGDGICDNVIDVDGDGVNDITGVAYSKRSLEGYRYGRVDEESGIVFPRFLDEDGDGMNDGRAHADHPIRPEEEMDLFIDEDGDGICDGRSFIGRSSRGMVKGMMGRNSGDRETGPGHMGEKETDSEKRKHQHKMGGGR